jgi:ATP-dependent DNA helicase RecQ
MSVDQIARERDMVQSTIEGHLAMFIPAGKVQLTELVPDTKIDPIKRAIALHGDQSLGLLKTELGDGYTYGEIRAVVASMQ